MITPLDIEDKDFKSSFLGYKKYEVDDFLDNIKLSYEKIYKEHKELNDKIIALQEDMKKYKNIEETLKNTLLLAQNTAEEVSSNAAKKAKVIIEEANLEAKEIIRNANKEVGVINREYDEIQKKFLSFKDKYKFLLNTQLQDIDKMFDLEEE
ncbi:MAG: DivIVA domain-containing protein [Peptostreptococcaceae bacterium]|jgi:cell division initiation protein|nr:DivIVA domain-containing protein [Peptostreptococcaceae bacterium]